MKYAVDGVRVLTTQWAMAADLVLVCVAFRHFSSVCHNVAFVDVCRCFRGFVFDVVIEFNFMVVLLPLLLHLFLFSHLFKSFSGGCSFDWRALPLSVSKQLSLYRVRVCVCVLFFYVNRYKWLCHRCVIRLLLLSHNVFFYCVRAYMCYSSENSLAMRLAHFADKHKITQCLLSIKWNDCKAKRASSFSLGWITIHSSVRFAHGPFFFSLYLFLFLCSHFRQGMWIEQHFNLIRFRHDHY